ncbi:MAG: vWA domain-containing protein, partial [Armatimonadota bacterium]
MIALALILALAGAQLVRPAEKLTVVFAVDASHSVPDAQRRHALELIRQALGHRRPGQRCALVVFGRRAMVEAESLVRPDDVQITGTVDGGSTDIAGALRLALGLIPPETAGRIVLCSDGNENLGAAREQLLAAEAGRVTVDVLPLHSRSRRDALVADVSVPSEARRDEPFE